jgi:ATP-dependent DNA helicase RecG
MTPEQVEQLIATGETMEVEFKGEEKDPLNDRDLLEAVVCLCNRPGNNPAYLLVGVEDDRRITGARPRHPSGKTDVYQLQALIANRTRPSQSCRVELLTVAGKEILVIEVPPSRAPRNGWPGRAGVRAVSVSRNARHGGGTPDAGLFHVRRSRRNLG